MKGRKISLLNNFSPFYLSFFCKFASKKENCLLFMRESAKMLSCSAMFILSLSFVLLRCSSFIIGSRGEDEADEIG
jgi:hypothetical protein